MKKVKITALRRTCYPDLIEQYENPIEHACDTQIGMVWVSENGESRWGFATPHGGAWSFLSRHWQKAAETSMTAG